MTRKCNADGTDDKARKDKTLAPSVGWTWGGHVREYYDEPFLFLAAPCRQRNGDFLPVGHTHATMRRIERHYNEAHQLLEGNHRFVAALSLLGSARLRSELNNPPVQESRAVTANTTYEDVLEVD